MYVRTDVHIWASGLEIYLPKVNFCLPLHKLIKQQQRLKLIAMFCTTMDKAPEGLSAALLATMPAKCSLSCYGTPLTFSGDLT